MFQEKGGIEIRQIDFDQMNEKENIHMILFTSRTTIYLTRTICSYWKAP
jgi:hypothetical protein